MRGTSIETCDLSTIGNGKCDYTNNMVNNQCQMDGGDCCLTTCFSNCLNKQGGALTGSNIPYSNPSGRTGECASMCGVRASPMTNCPYLCLDDGYVGVGASYTSWCSHTRGTQSTMSNCYSTFGDIVTVLQECLMDEWSHGNDATSSSRCGNQTLDCTLADVTKKIDGCHLHPSSCTGTGCCSLAVENGWINPGTKVMPSRCDLYATCAAYSDCFPSMAKCARNNKACQGGCCICNAREWYGSNCDQPLCWPRCQNGRCVAPNMCHCDDNWSGDSCEIPVCSPSCVAGQGVCVAPNTCECFYGFEGEQCQNARSIPPCVNGHAIAADTCMCDPGWGGRICDYPLCQSYPVPSSDCGHGVCEAPWQCKCEPGWSLTIPVGADGLDILPTFWKGRDTSGIIAESDFVFGDSRFAQSLPTYHIFDEYNAYKCNNADCRIIADAHCNQCAEATGACTACDSGFYLQSGRCLRCQLRYTGCRQCDASRCLGCDPLYALVDGVCVSDGVFEFTSKVYHVLASDPFAEVQVIRTVDSLADLSWSQRDRLQRYGISLIVQTVVSEASGAAITESSDAFSDFGLTGVVIKFPALSPADLVGKDPSNKAELRSVYTLSKTVRIPIYDNMRFDALAKSFKVRLVMDPEVVAGSTVPLRPEPGLHPSDPQDPLPITEADVYIYDNSVFDYTTCEIKQAFANDPTSLTIGAATFTIPVKCSLCTTNNVGECTGFVPFSAVGETVSFVSNSSLPTLAPLLTTTATGTFDGSGYLLVSASQPLTVVDSFHTDVHAVFPGIIARHYLLNAVPAAGQIPDSARKETMLNQTWDLSQNAPALLLYSGFLHFGCSQGAAPPASIGVAVAGGATVELFVSGISKINVQRTVSTSDSDLLWQAPMADHVWCGNQLTGLFCYNRTDPVSNQAVPYLQNEVVSIDITFKPSQLFYHRPTGIRFLMLDGTDLKTWREVPGNCLLAPVDIRNSPLRGLKTVNR